MISFLRYGKIFRLYELIQPYLKYSLPLENKLPASRILVIAPHADDESIGCGGSICLHTAGGGRADVVFCTSDGKTREDEAAAALKILGVQSSVSFGFGVETLKSVKSLSNKLHSAIEEKGPEIVLLPFFMDNHEDHRAVNKALADAYGKGGANFMIYAYPVWFPLYPNVLIDTGGVLEKKNRAIECYKSQTASRDYVKMAGSLGQYWAQVKGRGLNSVETFFRATPAEYFALVSKNL